VAELMAVPVSSLYANPAERAEAVGFTAQRAGRFSTKELQLRCRDGSPIWVAVTSRAELDAAGKVRWLEGILQDITERRRAEEAVRRSEARYRELVQSVNSIILRRDVGGRITFVNEYAQQFFGYAESELLGRNIVGTILPATESTGRDLAAMARDIGRQPERYALNENENMRRGGERVWVSWTNKPIRDEAGRVVEILAVGNDITERRRSEAERRRLEGQLRQADKMQAVGELAGGIAHDFNNHLAAIMGCAEMLVKRLEGDPAARYAQMTAKAAGRAADLTEQLLAYARRGRCRDVRVDLHAVVDEVIGLLEHSIDRRIRIGRDLRAEDAGVMGDPAQLHNALLNIAVNARDAMADGGEMTFATELRTFTEERCRQLPYEMRPGRYLAVSVRDTGVGMSEDVRKRLFQPFFTTKPVGKGTGMGLAAVYGTVKSHHGAVEVQSASGAGSTFTLLLPLAPEPGEHPPSPEESARPAGAGASVLLVDDEELVREAVAGNLRELGYRVTVCADGAEAVRSYRKGWGQIDLVLLDLLMPEVSGREAFLAMRQVNPEVRAVFMSGYSAGQNGADPLADGAVSFLRKPFNVDELARALSAALAP
jgi:PAS domain S-box-containing protein